MTDNKHGGKRKGAGRPVTGKNETSVIRVDAALVPAINEIKAKYRKTQSLDNLINVTNNQEHINVTSIQVDELEKEIIYLKGLRTDKELHKEHRELLLKVERLEVSALVDQATIDKLIAEKASNKPDRKPVKKPSTNYKEGTVIEVLARFLPDGMNNTNDMRSALSDGYRKANGITGSLKADDAPGLNE